MSLHRITRRVTLVSEPIPRPFFRHHRPDPNDPSEEGMHYVAFGFEAPSLDWWVGIEIDLAPGRYLDVDDVATHSGTESG